MRLDFIQSRKSGVSFYSVNPYLILYFGDSRIETIDGLFIPYFDPISVFNGIIMNLVKLP